MNSGGEKALIAYLDTSAVVPLLVAEPATGICQRIWDDADSVVSCRLLYVETAAALAQARRLHRLTAREHTAALTLLDDLWAQIDVVEVDDALVRHAAELAHHLALRGYDAVHCASAHQLADPDLIAATGDGRLLAAWRQLGLATVETKPPDP